MMAPADARSYIRLRIDFAQRHLARAKAMPRSERTDRFMALMSAVQAAEEAQGAANVAGARLHKTDLSIRVLRAQAQEIAAEARTLLSKVCFPHRRKPKKTAGPDPKVLNAAARAIDRYTRSL